MAVRNPHIESVDVFNGLNSLTPATNLKPDSWIGSSNVVVGSTGTAVAMRSPNLFFSPFFSNNPIFSIFSFQRGAGLNGIMGEVFDNGDAAYNIFDVDPSFGSAVVNEPFGAQSLQTRSSYLNVNNRAYVINNTGQYQFLMSAGPTFLGFLTGITPPAAAPTVSIVAGGSVTINVGVTVSYAYYDPDRGHVGQCSAPSTISGTTGGGNNTLQIAVVPSPAPSVQNVNYVVLFISLDGGAIRYLLVDANGDPIKFLHTIGNINLSTPYLLDQNTTETTFNVPPPQTATGVLTPATSNPTFQFKHQDRVFMMGFPASSADTSTPAVSNIIYSGLESISIGVPAECYPPLNIVTIPVRGEPAIGGISTPVGALIFSDRNAYLLSGQVIDITISAQNTLQSSYRLDDLGWNLGTRSPFTIKATPFGVVWLDQNKRIQLWPYSGLPTEIGVALRDELAAIDNSAGGRFVAEATWFQPGEEQWYVLSASTGNATYKNNKLFVVGIYEAAAHQTNAYQTLSHPISVTTGVSDIAAQSIISYIDNGGVSRCLIVRNTFQGAPDGAIYEIMNLDLQGDGWDTGQTIYFDIATGNFPSNNNWSTVHSVRYDVPVPDITVQTRNFDDSGVITAKPVLLANENQTLQAMIQRYGIHKKMRFQFPTDDSKRREIQNLRITYSGKTRP